MGTPSVTIVRTGTSYPTIQAAVAASQKGDTLNIQGTTDGGVGVCQAQTLSAAGALTLNGTLVSAGIANLVNPRRVTMVSTANDMGVVFTVTGTDASGNPQTDTITRLNKGEGHTLLDFSTVTGITSSAATAGSITAGTAIMYNEAEMNVDWDIDFVVVGDAKSAKTQPYNSAAGTWRAVTKGLFVIGQAGTYPHVTFNGLHITQCSASLNNSGEIKGGGWGLVIPEGAPLQTGDGNGAGIRFQAGDLTFENGLIDYCQDGILGQPFIWGTGNITLSNSTFRWCGTGLGQQHNLYIGRVKTVTITNVTSDHSLAGQNIKSRAVTTTVTGCNLGTTDANDFSNNQLQCIEGTLIASGLTLARGPGAQNPFPIEIGGVVPMYLNTTVSISDVTLNDQYGKSVALVWNWFPIPVSVSGFAVTTIDPTPPPVFNGLGTFTGVSFNGAAIPDGVGTPCQAISNIITGHIVDLSDAAGPQTVTLATDTAYIGGPGVLSGSSTDNMSGVQVISGPGGCDINVSPPGGGVGFANHPTDAPSTVYVSNPQNIFSNTVAAPGAGDQITIDKNGGSYVLVSGQGAVINHYNQPTGSAGHFEVKQAYPGIVPNCGVVLRGSTGGSLFIDNGGTVNVTGTVTSIGMDGYSPAGAESPAVFNVNSTWKDVNYQGTFTGGAFNITQAGTRTVTLVNSYSDPFCVNVYQPGAGNWEFTALLNDILDFGSSVGATAVTTPASYLVDISFAVVAGSAASSVSVNGPGLIQVIGGHNDGGTLTVSNYNPTHAAECPVAMLGGVTAGTPTAAGSNYTTVFSNGTTLVTEGAAPNFTLPAGSNDLVLTAPAVSGAVGVARPLGATVTDAYAAATVGFVQAKVTGVAGCTVSLSSFVGTWAELVAALAAATVTPMAATGSFTLTVWNQAGYSQSVTVVVTGAGLIIDAPASIELNSGTICAIPGLSISDAASGTVSVTLTAAGTVTPTAATGSAADVTAALASAQYGSGLVAGTDTVHLIASDSVGNTASADIGVKIDWSPAWDDIAIVGPGAQTISAGGNVSLAGATITDALATAAGVQDTLLVTNGTGTLLTTSGSPAALQAALDALLVPEPAVGSDAIVVTVGNPAGFSASGTVDVVINPAVVQWPTEGGTFTETSNGTTYETTGTAKVTATITGSGNTFVAGANGSITLTDNTGGNMLSPPGITRGNITLTNGAQWATETFDLRELLTSAGYAPGGLSGPADYLQVGQEGSNAHLQAKNAGGAWVDKLVLTGATVTLDQILKRSTIP